jgi:hypothetical protein
MVRHDARPMTARLLMIGLDGADGGLLDRYSADGSLPQLAALRARGGARRLSPPPGLTDDALWASFQYAGEVGEHGRYHFRLPQDDGGEGKAHWRELDRTTFWDELSSRGRRVAILDVPKCRNPRPLNGLHLADWLVHGRYFPKPRGQPPSLAAEVLARFGPAPPSRCGYTQPVLDDGDIREIIGNLRGGVAQKRAAGLHYLAAEPWDLFVIGFKEAHCASHGLWDFDAGHPVMVILRDIDAAIGDLVAAAGPDAEVVVFTPTDIETNGGLHHLMPEIVERLNARLSADRAGGRCAILPYTENCAALRVSGDGQTPPNAGLLQAIEAELLGLRDADSGQAVVSAITRPSSQLQGSRTKSLPDLLIHGVSGGFPHAITSPSLGRIEGESPSMRPGNHIAGGFVIAAGALGGDVVAEVRTVAGLGALARAVLEGRGASG